MSKKQLMPFMFKLAANLALELDNFQCIANRTWLLLCERKVPCKFYSFINSRTISMHFNSCSDLNLCFRSINDSLIWYASYTYEIFRDVCQIIVAMRLILNVKAISLFLLTLCNIFLTLRKCWDYVINHINYILTVNWYWNNVKFTSEINVI